MSPESFHILLVEDSAADARLIERAMAEVLDGYRLTVLPDGRRALEYLERLHEPDCPALVEPDLILLDLNLPGLDGCQVLAQIKSDPILAVIPVVMLTTSSRDEDVRSTYQAGANSFIAKPAEYSQYPALMTTLHHYWHETTLTIRRVRPDQ